MKTVAVIGADSFIGQHLISLLCADDNMQIRALVHDSKENCKYNLNKVKTIKGDLLEPDSLNNLLVADCSVINLAYLWQRTKEENLQALANLVQLCRRAKVKRFIHCSTAIVAGRVNVGTVTETTICQPVNDYEKNKLAMEQLLLHQLGHDCEIAILRPTGVFGPGGKNLMKLAADLIRGKRWLNYLKSSLFGQRRMNLVWIENVVAALKFLLDTDKKIDQEIFIISDDEYSLNNYRALEKFLMGGFAIKDYPVPALKFLAIFLPLMLWLANKSDLNPNTIYSCQKIKAFGLVKPLTLEQGLEKFVAWYKKNESLKR